VQRGVTSWVSGILGLLLWYGRDTIFTARGEKSEAGLIVVNALCALLRGADDVCKYSLMFRGSVHGRVLLIPAG
jgi:hypothetical protein